MNKEVQPAKKNAAKKAAKKATAAKKVAAKRVPPEERPLKDIEEIFVETYLANGMNATDAYCAANPLAARTTGRTQGSRWLAKPNIAAAIERARIERARTLNLKRDDVLRQYVRLGFSDPRKLFDDDGRLKEIHELDGDTAAALAGYEIEMRMLDGQDQPPVPVLKVKWADKRGALDSIMRAQGWNLPDKVEHTGKDGGPIEHAVRVVLIPPKKPAEVTVSKIERKEQ